MYLSLRNTLGFAVLAGAAIASWYLGSDGLPTTDAGDVTPSGPLGYYLRDADISVMDADGSVLYRISADAVEERPAENRTVLSRVQVRYSPVADVPWEVSAELGEIPTNERYLDLSGTVELSSAAQPGREATVIQAPRIRFAPDDYLATTETPVSVVLGTERLEAVGMRADLKSDFLELESSVHGQFNP